MFKQTYKNLDFLLKYGIVSILRGILTIPMSTVFYISKAFSFYVSPFVIIRRVHITASIIFVLKFHIFQISTSSTSYLLCGRSSQIHLYRTGYYLSTFSNLFKFRIFWNFEFFQIFHQIRVYLQVLQYLWFSIPIFNTFYSNISEYRIGRYIGL